jgi:hypothetical protein
VGSMDLCKLLAEASALIEQDQFSDVSVPLLRGTARVICRDASGRLVFGNDLPLTVNTSTVTAWGPKAEICSWNRRIFRIGSETAKEIKSLEQKLSRARGRHVSGIEMADDEAALARVRNLQESERGVIADGQCAVMALIPYGQHWFHVARLRRGTQKGPLALQNWWHTKLGAQVAIERRSDLMRYVEELYADTATRFGPALPWDPFETTTDVSTAGFPEAVWPDEFSAFEGQQSRLKSRPDDGSHICIGLLSEPFESCVREIAGYEPLIELVQRMRSGSWSGKHRNVLRSSAASRRRNADDVRMENVEPELYEDGLLEEYAWLSAMKALAGPPDPSYYRERDRPTPDPVQSVGDYACYVLQQIVGSTDRRLMRRRERGTDSASGLTGSFADRLIGGDWETWSDLRKMLRNQKPTQDLPASSVEEVVATLAKDFVSAFYASRSIVEVADVRRASLNTVRLLLRQRRPDTAHIFVRHLEMLSDDDAYGAIADGFLPQFLWLLRCH